MAWAKLTKDFAKLSCQEVLFHVVVQASSYEKVATRHPDCYTTYHAIMHSEGNDDDECKSSIKDLHKKASEARLDTKSMLFWHILDFETKLVDFIMEAETLLQMQQNCIWIVVNEMTEDGGAPVGNGLTIALHLLDMLPTLPANLTFNAAAPLLTGFVLEVYASQPWLALNALDLTHTLPPQSDQMAMNMLKDEVICLLTATAVRSGI